VLVLLPQSSAQPAAELAASIEQFISSCWDAGLEIGSSVRSIAECLQEAAQDLTVQTAMLESRRITGSKALFADFEQQFARSSIPRLCRRQAAGDAPAPRKIRLHALRWSPTARNRPAGCAICTPCSGWPRPRLGNSWHELAEQGLITHFEVQQLESNEPCSA
jgi:[protein-PII] uridylyltransferase